MPRPRLIAFAAVTAAVAVGTAAYFSQRPAPTPATVAPATTAPTAQSRSVTVTASPEEIFRRAFWRHPAAGDRIVHADRHEWVDDGHVQRWQWFLEVRPDPSLLHALRDPDTLGLVSAAPSSAVAQPLSPPSWFPSAAQRHGYEVLRSPAGGLTVFYRAADNVLFATDTGRGFAAPVVAVSR